MALTGERSDDPVAPITPLVRETSLGYQINHLARLMERALRVRIEQYGVAPGQFAQLLTLYEEEHLTQRELCERVHIEQPTMANTLKRMERDGLVYLVADTQDGRQMRVMLTARAREIEGALIAVTREVNALALRGLDESEAGVLMRAITRLIGNLESAESV